MVCPTFVAHLRYLQPKSLVFREMVGDPGIEPGVSRLEGVTVPCHTLRPVAHTCAIAGTSGADTGAVQAGQA